MRGENVHTRAGRSGAARHGATDDNVQSEKGETKYKQINILISCKRSISLILYCQSLNVYYIALDA